ncbi:uncharacterized protein LOC130622945 isoform X2 [Hydractinia symbiolongicarpus]|uniref:uncharacterized protein LOC130622945 isoform X2 n=1 Tax=Hydractinia symbiolongicarpus TaxID=13093 RepID=UPI0025503A24|nr:uncharacterized protein LOC130622945 isoform X2 [Hydractinia symbiolongicarpus]
MMLKALIFFSTLTQYVTVSLADIESLGCWKDANKKRTLRSMEHKHHYLDDPYPKRSNAVKKCAQVAIDHGYSIFGVQNGGQCFSAPDGEKTYNMYGPSNLCRDGKGGKWSTDIYSTKTFHARSIHKSIDPSPWDAYCSRDLDIVILMDGSGSTSKKNKERWSEIKKFCTKFVKGFDDHARIGVIRYGADPDIVVDMHKGKKPEDIGDEIKPMDMPGGSRTLNDALKRAWREQLKENNRSAADKVVLAITTGDIPYGLYGSSQFLSDHDVRVIALGVDKNVHYEFLQSIASYRDVSNVFSVNSEQLSELAPFVYRDVCNTMPEYVSAPTPSPTKPPEEAEKNITTASTNSTETKNTTATSSADNTNITNTNTTNNSSTASNNTDTSVSNNNNNATQPKSRYNIPFAKDTINILPSKLQRLPMREKTLKKESVHVVGSKKAGLPKKAEVALKGRPTGTVFDNGMKKNVVTAVKKGAAKEEVATMVLVNPSPELNLFITDAEANAIHNRKPTGEGEYQYSSTSKDTVSKGNRTYYPLQKLPSYSRNITKPVLNRNPDIKPDENVFSDLEGTSKNDNQVTKEFEQDQKSLETLSNTDDKIHEKSEDSNQDSSASSATVFTPAENNAISDKTAFDNAAPVIKFSKGKATKSIDSSNHNKDVSKNSQKLYKDLKTDQESDKMNSKLLKLKSMEREDLNKTSDMSNKTTNAIENTETMSADEMKSIPSDDGKPGEVYYDNAAAEKEGNGNAPVVNAETFDGGENKKGSDSKIVGPGVVSQTVELHSGNGKKHVSDHPEMHVDYNNFFSGKLNDKLKSHEITHRKPMFNGRTIITPDKNGPLPESTITQKNLTTFQNSSAFIDDAGKELAEIYDKVHKINADLDDGKPSKAGTLVSPSEEKSVKTPNNASQYQFTNAPTDTGPSVFEMDVDEHRENKSSFMSSEVAQTMPNTENVNTNALPSKDHDAQFPQQNEQKLNENDKLVKEQKTPTDIVQPSSENSYHGEEKQQMQSTTVATLENKTAQIEKTESSVPNIESQESHQTSTVSNTEMVPNNEYGENNSNNIDSANNKEGQPQQNIATPVAVSSEVQNFPVNAASTNNSLSSSQLQSVQKSTQINKIPFNGNVMLQEDHKVDGNNVENSEETVGNHLTKKQDVHNTEQDTKDDKTPSDVETVGSLVGAVEQVSKDAAALAQQELDNMNDRRSYKTEDLIGGDYNEGFNAGTPNYDYAVSDDEQTRNALQERRQEINNLLKILDKEDQNNLLGKGNASNRNKIQSIDESAATRELKAVFDKINERIRFIHTNKRIGTNSRNNHLSHQDPLKYVNTITEYGDSGAIRSEPVTGKINIDGANIPFVSEEMSNSYYDNDAGDSSTKGVFNRRKPWSKAKNPSKKFENQNKEHISPYTTDSGDSDLTSEKVSNLNKQPSKKVPAIKHKTNRVPTSALILNKDDIQDVKTAAVSFQLPTNQKNQNNGMGPGTPATKQNKATSTNSSQKKFDKTGITNSFKLPRIKTSALTIKVDDDDDQKGKGKINKMLQSYAQHVQKISTETKNQQKIDEHNKKIVNKISKLVDAIKPVDNAQAIPYKIPESNSMEANLSPEPYRPDKSLSQGEKAKNEKKLSKQKFQNQKKKPALYPGPSRPLINVSNNKISSLQNISFIPVPVDPHTHQSNIIYSQPTQYNDYQKKITNFQPKPVDQKNQQFAQTSSKSNESIVGQIVSFNPVLDGQKLDLHPVVNNAIITNTDSSFNKNLNSIGKPYISINHAHTKNLINNKGPTIGAYDNEDLVQQVNTLKTFVKGNNLQDHMLVNLNGINQKSSNQFLSRLPLPNHHSLFFEKTYSNIKPGHGIGVPFEPKLKEQYKIGNYVNNFHGSNIFRPINSTLGREENRLKLVSSKYKHLNLNTLSRKDVAPKHTIKSHKVTQPEIPADVASMTSIGQGVKPRLNSHARPTLVPHHPPDFNSLFEHVRKTGVSVHHKSKSHYVKGEKKTLQQHRKKTWKDSLGWARQEIAKERKLKKIKGSKKSGTWTEGLFRPIKGNPLLRKHFVINHKRGNTKLASTLRKILLATNSNQTKKTPRKHKPKERKNFLQNEDKEFNMLEKKIKNIEATISKTTIIRKKPKETVTASVRDELSSTVRREDGSSPRNDKKTFLDLLNRRGRPMTEQDVNTVQNYWSGRYASNPAPNTYTNAYSRNIPAKTTSAGGTSPFSQIAKELYRVRKLYNSRVKGNEGKGSFKHGMKHKTESLSAKKQSINENKVKNLDILNLEDKPESNWKDLITGELDKEMSEDDQIRLYNKKIDSSKQIEVGKNKYVFETTPAMSKQIINRGNKPTAKTEVMTDADFPKKFSIADFKLSDLPTLPKGKSYVLSTPSLGYVMVRIRADSSFDDENNKRKSPYFREIEELSPEEVSKHASDLSKSYATEKEIAQAVHKTDTEKEIAEAIHQKIPHEKTFFQAIKDSSESFSEPLEESIHSKSTEGRKPQAIVTYVGNPVSRHRAISSEVNEQSDEPQYHTASQHTIPDKQLQPNMKQNTVDVIKTEDTYEPIEVQLSKTATNPRIVTNSIFGGKVQSYSNSSTFLNSSIESNVNDAESEGLINMVHSVIKENAKESKNFLQQKPKGSVIVGATLTPEKENDGELSNLINKIHSLNSQINDASANTSAPHVQDSNNKNLTVFMTNATTDSEESATVNKPQKINNTSSDDKELPVVFNTSKAKTHAKNKTEDDNQIAFQNASISNEHIQDKTDKDFMATLKLKNNGSNTQETLEEEKLASVFDKNESSDNHTESITQPDNYSFKDENSLPKFSPVVNGTDKSLSNNNSLNTTSTKDIFEVSEKTSVNGNFKNSTVQNLTSGNKNLKNSTVQNLTLLKPNEDEKEHFTNTTLISMVKNGTYSNKVDNKTVGVTKTSELSEKNSTIDDADTNSMSSLEYTLGCNKPLRILYAIDVSDGLGAGPIRKKRWNRLKEFIGSINRDVIHNVRHHFMVYNIEPRFLKTFDTCDKDTEYFMTADECLCSKKDRISSSSGCSVNNPTMGESMEDWGTSGPRTGQALTRARKEFFAKDIHKYKNVIFLISHKDSMDSVEKAENDLKRDGISLVDIELGDRHDLKRRNIVQKVRHRHNHRRSDIENDSSSPSQDEHKMKVSLKKLQTTLRNIVGKVCKAQTDDDASKKSSIHQMSV